MQRAACTVLAAALPACASSRGNVLLPAAQEAARHGAVTTAGPFGFPGSVQLAEIYGRRCREHLRGTGPAGSEPTQAGRAGADERPAASGSRALRIGYGLHQPQAAFADGRDAQVKLAGNRPGLGFGVSAAPGIHKTRIVPAVRTCGSSPARLRWLFSGQAGHSTRATPAAFPEKRRWQV